MMNNAESKIDLIIGIAIILQVLFKIEVPDIRRDMDVIVIGVDPDPIAIIAVNKRGIGEKPVIEDMIPTGRTGGIPIVDTEGLPKSQVVPAEISREIDTVLFVELIIGFYIQIIEIERILFHGRVAGQFEKKIGIGAAAADGKRALVLYNGAFCIETGGDQPNATSYMILLVIAIVHFNIHG